MTLDRNKQIRSDLNAADAVVRAVWDNFKATEPTYVLRDLIVIEIDKARNAEREACAKIADHGMLVPPDGGSPTQDEIDTAERIAAAIRSR